MPLTKSITGYKFNVEQSAVNSANALRVHFLDGRPTRPVDNPYMTTEVVKPKHNQGASGDFWWFNGGDYEPVLGSPTVFNIDIETGL